MLDFKSGFHIIPFESTSSFDSIFATSWGKFQWLRMLMGLAQVPAHFQFVVESVLRIMDNCLLPIVIYLENIAIYGDTQEQVLEDTLEAIK